MNTDTKTLENKLKELGLADKEARVYLASLELGSDTVQNIAKKSGVNRATVHVIIAEKLIKKGLMSSFKKDKKTFYQVESPEQLLRLLREQEENLKRKEDDFKKYLPELETLYNIAEEKPKVRFFEGKEGLISIQNDILRSKFDSVVEFIPLDDRYEVFSYTPQNHQEQIRRIPKKIIYSSKSGQILPKKDFTESKAIPFDKFPLNAEVVVYGDKVALASVKNKLVGVIIESKEIANSLKTIFSLAWESAEKYQK